MRNAIVIFLLKNQYQHSEADSDSFVGNWNRPITNVHRKVMTQYHGHRITFNKLYRNYINSLFGLILRRPPTCYGFQELDARMGGVGRDTVLLKLDFRLLKSNVVPGDPDETQFQFHAIQFLKQICSM